MEDFDLFPDKKCSVSTGQLRKWCEFWELEASPSDWAEFLPSFLPSYICLGLCSGLSGLFSSGLGGGGEGEPQAGSHLLSRW